MALHAIIGQRDINDKLLRHAAQRTPALVIDCTESIDPETMPPEGSDRVYLLGVDLLADLRDLLGTVANTMARLRAHTIIVTTFDRIAHDGDDWERRNLSHQAWERLRALGEHYDVIVGIREGTLQEELARRHARTARWTARQAAIMHA